MSKVTIIIVSYNERELLKRALDSCQKQTFRDVEIVIGDDGSNDGSIQLIEEFCQQNYSAKFFVMNRPEKVTTIIPSLRVSNVIKKALLLATGDYVTILSGDDYYCDARKLEKAVLFLDGNNDYFAYVSGHKKVGAIQQEYIPRIQPHHLYFSRGYIHISGFTFRRISPKHLLERFCDDTGMEYSLMLAGKWKIVPEISVAYYQRSDGISGGLDKIELSIVEIMIFQDIQNNREGFKYQNAVRARYFRHVVYLLKNRAKLIDVKYNKYLLNCEKYDNDLLKELVLYDDLPLQRRISLKFMVFRMGIDYQIYRVIRAVFKLIIRFRKEEKS